MPSRPVSLALVLGATALTLAAGALLKAPCASGDWSDGRQYDRLCYSDIVPLYSGRGLDEGLFPYLEAENEYPVLTGLSMAAAGAVAGGTHAGYFWATALLLSAGALVTAWGLHRLAGPSALLFAAAPTLALYAFMNWDLIAVALATVGTMLFLRRRDGWGGALLGLGAAAKLYPALFVVPFAAQRLAEGRRRAALMLAGATAGTWAMVNLPFALAAPTRWSEFFRFSSERPADWDSMWLLAQRHLGFSRDTGVVNVAAAVSFVSLGALVWWLAERRAPGFPRWTLGFPLLVLFLLTSKVYSPQFSLWLLPWFALALPDLRLFVAFSLADVTVFVTRFTWFGSFEEQPFPSPQLRVALLLRAAVLATCVVAWVQRVRVETPEGEAVAA